MKTIEQESIELLQRMIATPSPSRDEAAVAEVVAAHLQGCGIAVRRLHNNLWAQSRQWSAAKPTLMLNSHIDTVRPAGAYTRDPYAPTISDGRLYGLGSNDAGASVVSLIAAFRHNYDRELPFNLLLAITAEEEVTGPHGLAALLASLPEHGITVDMALVGEPTGMQPAVAERGLVVLDGEAHGRTGHAARAEGDNAIYHALDDINALRNYRFARQSDVLGPISVNVTMVNAGTQHNVVPDSCRFVVDVRTTDAYSNEEVVALLRQALPTPTTTLTPRSTRIRASVIAADHPLVVAAKRVGGTPYVSPTTSDMCLMGAFPSLKMGPGDSARSHTADEYIYLDEISTGIAGYRRLLDTLAEVMQQQQN